MTTRELLHRAVDALPDQELEGALEYIASRRSDRLDEWGDLSTMLDGAADDLLEEMDVEEAEAGFGPWPR